MRTNLERLEFIDVERFYCITIRPSGSDLQGDMSTELIKYCVEELGAKFEVSPSGFLESRIHSIELGDLDITLT